MVISERQFKPSKPPRGASTLSFPAPGGDMHVITHSKSRPGLVGRLKGQKTQEKRTVTNVGRANGGNVTETVTEKVPKRKGGGRRLVSETERNPTKYPKR